MAWLAGGVPMVYSSSTLPALQVVSSLLAESSQMDCSRSPVEPTSTRRWDRCMARKAVRGSVLVHGTSSDDGAPTVTWVTPWIGWKRS